MKQNNPAMMLSSNTPKRLSAYVRNFLFKNDEILENVHNALVEIGKYIEV
jgi:hypothetical protein